MSRNNPVEPGQMTEEQRRVYDEIVQGPRGRVQGPFRVLLKSPEAASRMQRVGEYLRFGSILSARIRMLAVLVTARAWTAQYEWQVHVPQALEAGLDGPSSWRSRAPRSGPVWEPSLPRLRDKR